MGQVLRVVKEEFRVEISRGNLDFLLQEFYHYLRFKGVIHGDEACMACQDLVYDFVIAQEWVEEEDGG